MRTLLMLSALTTAACSSDTVHLQHTSTLTNATRGLVLLGDGLGHGAMLDTTCAFDGAGGFVFADINLPTDTERIGGAHGDLIVGFSAHGVHEIHVDRMMRGMDTAWDRSRDIPVSGVLDAKATDLGAVYLRRQGESCLIGGRSLSAELDAGACSPSAQLVTDLAGTEQWLLDSGALRAVTAQGVTHVTDADHATFDRLNQSLLVAHDRVVTRFSPAGGIDLQVELGQPVLSLTDLGARDGFAAVTGQRRLVMHNRAGDRIANIRLPQTESVQVVTSDDGRDLSLVTERESHNYTLADGPPNPGNGVEVIQFSD